MNPKIMEVVSLIGNFVADHWDNVIDGQNISDELLNVGFSSQEVNDAFKWIEEHTIGNDVAALQKTDAYEKFTPRPLTSMEQLRVLPKAYGILVSLLDRNVIDTLLFEEVIERAMLSDFDEVGPKEIKRIAALALFNRAQSDWVKLLKSNSTLLQ